MTEAAPRPGSGAATRGLAARAVESVIGAGRTLEDALASVADDSLAGVDRAQVRALAFGAVRWHHRHRELLAQIMDRPLSTRDRLLEALLSVGMFQLLDARQPDYAVVSATVEAARWLERPRYAGVVNAALRRLQRERDALLARADASPEGRHSHPSWLVERLRRDWPDAWQDILAADQRPPPMWLRINVSRPSAGTCAAGLAAAGIASSAGDLAGSIRLAEPAPVARIPGFAAGELTVQDLAAQLAAHMLAPAPGMRVLDACAAPGGKATHLLERAGGQLDLVALDVDEVRLRRVRENLERLRLEARTLCGDALRPSEWWDGRPFDLILVDAPCSATGVIRRHPDIKCLRRASDVAPLASRQLAMLEALWPLLHPGGKLLYSTCSVLTEENTGVVGAFLANDPGRALAAPPAGAMPAWAAPQGGGGWQALPGPADTDGLYYALMTGQRA